VDEEERETKLGKLARPTRRTYDTGQSKGNRHTNLSKTILKWQD